MAGTGVAVGRKDGRATALAVILPLKRGGRLYLMAWLALLRRSKWLRRWAFRPLDGLQFIYAIRWSLLEPYERPSPSILLAPERRWHLLFESNFDGDWDEYLENFASVIPKGLASLVWVGAGYTGLTHPSLFKRYAKLHDHLPEHYVSGYPELSAHDIRQEIVARYGKRAVRAIDQMGYASRGPMWSTIVLPIREGREAEAMRRARELDRGPGRTEGEAFRCTGKVHFARVVIDQQVRRSWLLMTLVHDGGIDRILEDVLAADRGEGHLHGTRPGALHCLLACTGGVPPAEGGWWDDERLVRHLLDHRQRGSRHALAYSGYPGFTVQDVLALGVDAKRHDRFPGWSTP